MQRFEETALLLHKVDDTLLGNHLSVDADTLAEVYEMGRGIESYLVAGLLENGCDAVRARAFAVGTGDMDRLISSVRMSKMFIQGLRRLEPWLISSGTDVLKHRCRME